MTNDPRYAWLYDYRQRELGRSWGKVTVRGRYLPPPILAAHRAAQIDARERAGQLHKGDLPAARVAGFAEIDGEPCFEVQHASYYDQVGTNLSLDVPLVPPVWAGDRSCTSVRAWDAAQAGLAPGSLPTLEQSGLANTLGVAVALGVTLEDGSRRLLRRKRSGNSAVYREQWHVPWSFAFSPSDEVGTYELRDYLRLDLGHELAEELPGVQASSLGTLRPLAFGRDLQRGGKPQLFLFAEVIGVAFEKLSDRFANARDADLEFALGLELEDGREDRARSDELLAAIELAKPWLDAGAPRAAPERFVFRRESGGTWEMAFGTLSKRGISHLSGFTAIQHALRGATKAADILRDRGERISEFTRQSQRSAVRDAIKVLTHGRDGDVGGRFPELGAHLKSLHFGTHDVWYEGDKRWETQ